MRLFKKHGILGINARNLLYIRPYNKKKAINLADNKLKSKHFLSARGIPVPKLYGVIKDKEEAESYDYNNLPNSFVIKPNFGFGGEGIIPIVDRKEQYWLQANGAPLEKDDIISHILDIIDGQFSISNIRDTAFFEQLIIPEDTLSAYSYKGLPDIRVVVHNLIPVMAMLRLPTKESGGKANLAQGAIGVGIDIARGEATYCTKKYKSGNKIIEEIPGKGKIRGLKIPFWDEILFISSKAQLITNLGYMAIDLAIDKTSGPIVLEINARAGLAVQVANLAPLKTRLEKVAGIKVTTPSKGVRVAKELFGNIAEKEISQATGKAVVGLEEVISLILKDQTYKVKAKTNTGELKSIIDKDFAESLNLLQGENYDPEKKNLKIKASISNTRVQTVMDIKSISTPDNPAAPKIILGSRDLRNFIIDPTKTTAKTNLPDSKAEAKYNKSVNYNIPQQINFAEIDKKLADIDSKLKLISYIKPLNLEEEKAKFFKKKNYNPHFTYKDLEFDPFQLYRQLDELEPDSSPLGQLFERKKQETQKKIALIEQRGNPLFTQISIDLYGKPSRQEYEEVLEQLQQIKGNPNFIQDPSEETITAEAAVEQFNKVFKKYHLHNWKAKIKESMVADCIAGKNNSLFVRKEAKFSPNRLENLIIHEIETHILTAENGKLQPYSLFQRGLGDYLITQEGLAVYNSERFGKDQGINTRRNLMTLVSNYLSLEHSFSELVQIMQDLGATPERAFNLALRTKRGLEDTSQTGGFTKGYIYWKGKRQIAEFIEKGGKLTDLYYGKYNIEDLPLIKKIKHLVTPKHLPTWIKE